MTLMERKTYHYEDLDFGMEASVQRTVTAEDIALFAQVSGDHNPMHLDPDFAATTPFHGCIAHGMLTASYISAVFAMEMPGPGAIYVSQTLNFRAPVRPGDVVTAKVSVVTLYPEKHRAKFACVCSVGGQLVLEGEAVLIIPSRHAPVAS